MLLLLLTLGLLIIGLSLFIYFILKSHSPLPPHSEQPADTVSLSNAGKNTMTIYIEYANYTPKNNGYSLDPPPEKWTILNGHGQLSDPINFYPATNPPTGANPPYTAPNDVGAGTWQLLTLEPGEWVLLKIPNFKPQQAWSIRPLKDGIGKPILIEAGRDMVADMSAVDGVNYFVKYTLTTAKGPTTIDFNTNPCKALGLNIAGCVNPAVDGLFKPGTNWESDPCPAGTCNTDSVTKIWCDTIHTGQCANSSTLTGWMKQGGPVECTSSNLYTTYCYSHDDASSSPTFTAPYKIQLIYSDLN